jgi:type IX secretion system PorP/SprF family membrane protein
VHQKQSPTPHKQFRKKIRKKRIILNTKKNMDSKIKIRVASILFGLIISSGMAQQNSQYTQYMYNTHIINPAYAGNRGMLSINSLYRTQWVGLDGSPETLNFSINSPIGDKRIGVGLSFISDKIGPSSESDLALDISYTINLSDETKLSFGMKGGINLLNVDYSKLNIFNPDDLEFSTNITNRLSPLIGSGLYLHNSDKWYLGISSPNFLTTKHSNSNSISKVKNRVHFYGITGYVFDVNYYTKLKPTLLTKIVAGAPLSLDLSVNFMFFDKFTLGAAYRLDAAGSFLTAFQISDEFMMGYAYDYDTTELGNYNSGSHEIFLRFEFTTKIRKIVNPRFF